MTNTSVHAFGMNIGNGFVKAILNNGVTEQSVIFPSIIAAAERQVAGAITKIPTTQFGGQSYWVGEDALNGRVINNISQSRFDEADYIPVLVRTALKLLRAPKEPGVAVTGLPASWADDRDMATKLGQRLRDASTESFSAAQIKVIAEPLGVLYSLALNVNGKAVSDPIFASGDIVTVDIGFRTVDLVKSNGLTPDPSSIASFDIGTSDPLNRIRQKINARYETDLSLFETDYAVRRGGLMVAGEAQPLPEGCEEELARAGREIAARLTEQLRGAGRIQRILIAGGGAAIPQLANAITARFKQAVVVPNSQLSVPTGYARLARRAANKVK